MPPVGPNDRPKADPGATISVILGAIGIISVVLSPILGPAALAGGIGAKKRIAASGGAIGGAGLARAAYVLGIIGTVMGALIILGVGVCFVMLAGI